MVPLELLGVHFSVTEMLSLLCCQICFGFSHAFLSKDNQNVCPFSSPLLKAVQPRCFLFPFKCIYPGSQDLISCANLYSLHVNLSHVKYLFSFSLTMLCVLPTPPPSCYYLIGLILVVRVKFIIFFSKQSNSSFFPEQNGFFQRAFFQKSIRLSNFSNLYWLIRHWAWNKNT